MSTGIVITEAPPIDAMGSIKLEVEVSHRTMLEFWRRCTPLDRWAFDAYGPHDVMGTLLRLQLICEVLERQGEK